MESTFKMLSLGYGAIGWLRNLATALLFTTGVAQADSITIAALGDSLTAGYGLETADGFVPQMQAWLDAQGAEVVLINAGVSGDTTAGGLSRTAWTLTPEVDAMIVALGSVGANYGVEYKQQFDAMYGELAMQYDVPLVASWFAGLNAAAGMTEGISEFLQADNLHPNAEGVRVIVDAMGPEIARFADTVR